MNDIVQWQIHSQEFYFYVGRCILKYQGVEDFLRFVFASGLRKTPDDVQDLYRSAENSLQRKYEFIEIALATRGSDEELKSWSDLKVKVQQAADKRNSIAHSEPVIYGGGIAIDPDANPPVTRRLGPQQWQARKRTKSGGVTILNLDDLKIFVVELEQLEQLLRDFTDLLRANNDVAGQF
jgi:hypothetical protein